MRYGKKLAMLMESTKVLLSEDDKRDSPSSLAHLSHKDLKTYLAQYVKLYRDGDSSRILCLQNFSSILSQDLELIENDVRRVQVDIQKELAAFLDDGYRLGILGSEHVLQLLTAIQRIFVSSNAGALQALLSESLRSVWLTLTLESANLAQRYNSLAYRMQSLASYSDINIAGFRKMLKQYSKQVAPEERISTVSVEDYRRLAVGVSELVSEFETIRTQLETVMKVLSPEAPTLSILRMGTESVRALAGDEGLYHTTLQTTNDTTISSSLSGSPDLSKSSPFSNAFYPSSDFMNSLKASGVDTTELCHVLDRL